MTGRGWISALRGTLLGSVLRAGLLTVGDAGRVERGADHLVAEARQVLDAAAAYEHHGVLLQVVALARDVGADLEPVRQANAGDLTKRRVRLLRGGRRDARADAALLRGSRERRGLGLRGLLRPALANQLIDGGHPETRSPLAGRMQTETAGGTLAGSRPSRRAWYRIRRSAANPVVKPNSLWFVTCGDPTDPHRRPRGGARRRRRRGGRDLARARPGR